MKKSNIIFQPVGLLKYSNVVVLFDSRLKKYKNSLLQKIKVKNAIEIPIRANESSKNISNVIQIYNRLSKTKIDKKSAVIALGGGVIGDISGFIAATYLRGIPFVSVPTTILSQVDSGIGGKNGVNLTSGKNLIGTVYQPDLIFIDSNYLKSLPTRELQSGLGEIFKYSLLNKKIKFPLNQNKSQFLKTIKKLTPQCVAYKMSLVKKDERDTKGIRQVLNLGHTFGHVLETLTSYKVYKHGEAVVWGIKFACIVSYLQGLMKFKDFRDIMNVANKFELPALPKNLSPSTCYNLALKDKKSQNQNVKMVLLKKIGQVMSNQSVSKKEFVHAVELLKDFR